MNEVEKLSRSLYLGSLEAQPTTYPMAKKSLLTQFNEGFEWAAIELMPLAICIIGAFAVFIGGLMIYAAVGNANSPDIVLKKSEWKATHFRPITTTVYVQSGNVMIPVTTTQEDPDEYQRIDR